MSLNQMRMRWHAGFNQGYNIAGSCMADPSDSRKTVRLQLPFTERSVEWLRTGDAEYPWRTEVDGQEWLIRVNDFPDNVLYSLMVDGAEVKGIDDWPAAWKRPALNGQDEFPDAIPSKAFDN